MTTKGWFYDGRLLDANMDSIAVNDFPSIWYTGAYLNFYPPKFVVARKVLKDTVSDFSKVRASIATFEGNGARIVQPFNPTCAMPDSNFDSNRTTYMNALDSIAFGSGTPLAKALLDVGKYYHSKPLPWFNNAWENTRDSSLSETYNANSYAICYSCQVSSVIVVTDGVPKVGDDGCSSPSPMLPNGKVTTLADAQAGKFAGDVNTSVMPTCPIGSSSVGGISTTDCPECGYFGASEDWKNNFTRVSWYLHNFDLRKNDEATKDCQFNGGRQTLDIYAIGFNNTFTPGAEAVLANAAKVGGGISVTASNSSEMRQALTQIQEVINTRATSFSVATLSTLQSQAGHSVIVPRFDPAKGPFWDGHLFRFELYSEFVNHCIPNTATDIDCDGTCGGVFLQDKLGHFIQEDGTGSFKVNEPDRPSCSESACGAGNCGLPGGADATPWWDSGVLLRDRSWKARYVYTVVDDVVDGRLDASDHEFRLVDDDATAVKLVPYLNLVGTPVCTRLAADIGLAGDPTTAAAIVVDTTYVACAKEIIRFALGADVLNSMNRTGTDYPPRASTTGAVDRSLLKDRNWKLGDIFHSSPVVVDPPSPSDGILCPRGLSRQCIPSLWATPVLGSDYGANGNAYDGYSKSSAYKTRRKMVVVGANDGMVHAFNGGQWLNLQDDPLTTGIDESKPPFGGYYERANAGDELWAFIPPDQLAKLHLMLGNVHYVFVDGTPMVRDVWVDGTANTLHSATTKDDTKQPWEFHTVAVMNERRGGVHHFALDITDAFQQDGSSAPKFLWLYPQPGDPRLLTAGEGYSDFLPTPPPIGPVRVKADATTGLPRASVTPTTVDATGASVPYHERWIAFLSGGFDPQYLRGRGVHMVDVWTGEEIFDFSYPMSMTGVAAADPRRALRYPVPATVAMVQWGRGARSTASFANEGYFDTATFGDAGGQLWVLRFNDPAVLDASTKLATNWFGGRVFQMGGKGSTLLCTNEPFFYITANVSLPTDGTLRVLAGTGDRYNLLDQYGGTCGPDNIRACLQRGCTVTEAATSNSHDLPGRGQPSERPLRLELHGAHRHRRADLLRQLPDRRQHQGGHHRLPGNRLHRPRHHQGPPVHVHERHGRRRMRPDGGRAQRGHDPPARRLEQRAHAAQQVLLGPGLRAHRQPIACSPPRRRRPPTTSPASPTPTWWRSTGRAPIPTTLSDASGNGWVLSFNNAPTVSIGEVDYSVSRPDERVSSTSAVAANCTFWNTTQTVSAAAGRVGGNCFVSNCKQLNRRIHYLYGADVTTGGLCGLTDPVTLLPVRATKAVALVPPPAPQYTIFVNQKGQVQVGLTSVNTEIGAKNIQQGQAVDPATVLEMLDVPRSLHDCRHSDPAGASPTNCK